VQALFFNLNLAFYCPENGDHLKPTDRETEEDLTHNALIDTDILSYYFKGDEIVMRARSFRLGAMDPPFTAFTPGPSKLLRNSTLDP
jgi:hypothetical protein